MNSKIKVLSVEDDERWQATIAEITSMLMKSGLIKHSQSLELSLRIIS